MGSTVSDFAPTMLRGLAELALPAGTPPDLALELGLTAWMRKGEKGVAEAQAAMVALRAAVLEAAEMDPSNEPVPLTGRSAKADLLNWAVYLADLVRRAARSRRCDTRLIVERSIRYLAA